jgi:hypothetical protein
MLAGGAEGKRRRRVGSGAVKAALMAASLDWAETVFASSTVLPVAAPPPPAAASAGSEETGTSSTLSCRLRIQGCRTDDAACDVCSVVVV